MTADRAWAFLSETALTLHDEMGWVFESTTASDAAPSNAAADIVTDPDYPHDVYALQLTNDRQVQLPPWLGNFTSGAWAFWFKVDSTLVVNNNYRLFEVRGSSGQNTYIRAATATSFESVVRNVVQGVGASRDYSIHRYIGVWIDVGVDPWEMDVYVDEVLDMSDTQAGATSGSATVHIGGMASGTLATTYNGMMRWTAKADPYSAPMIQYRPPMDTDQSNTNFPTLVGGGDYHTVLNPPLDVTSYAEEATPGVNDEVIIDSTGGAADDIQTLLGFTPVSIPLITGIAFMESDTAVNGAVVLDDDTGQAVGSTTAIGTSTTTADVGAVGPAGGGSWAGTNEIGVGGRIVA